MMTPVLEFRDIARSYKRNKPVLSGVNFSLESGEVVGLLGRNGAGKTTLIRIAMGMLSPQSGSVRIFGVPFHEDPVAVKKRIGYVAEDQILPAFASIGEIIALHRALFPSWDSSMEQQILDRFRLSPKSKINQLSKGQTRQVALLCAICHRPELLILDEPAGGLDPVARREFLELSIQLLNMAGTTILFSSHQMGDVERIGGRVVLLNGGKVQLDRSLDALREETCLAIIPKSAISDASAINALPGVLHCRPVQDSWHILLQGASEETTRNIEQSFNIDGIRCVRLPLEEFFIEMTAGN
jgi:ABC-2 type transport system ATP-binding protein